MRTLPGKWGGAIPQPPNALSLAWLVNAAPEVRVPTENLGGSGRAAKLAYSIAGAHELTTGLTKAGEAFLGWRPVRRDLAQCAQVEANAPRPLEIAQGAWLIEHDPWRIGP